jgi:hypothetical protein
MGSMRGANSVLALLIALLQGVFASGCSATVPCLPGEPSVNCCIKKFPLTPEESCGVPAEEAAKLLEAMEAAGEIATYENSAGEEETSAEGDGADTEATSAEPEPPK